MLLNILSDYLAQVEAAIQQCSNVDVERYEEEVLSPKRANLKKGQGHSDAMSFCVFN